MQFLAAPETRRRRRNTSSSARDREYPCCGIQPLGNLRSQTVGQIVDTDYAMPLAQQSVCQIAAYKAGTARDENRIGHSLCCWIELGLPR